MDFLIRKFKNSIVNLINSTQLPLEVKRLVVKEIYDELCVVTEEAIMQEQQAEQQKQEQEKQKVTDFPTVEEEANNG